MYQPHRPKKSSAPTSTTSSHRRRNSPTNSPQSRKTASETPAPTGPPKPKRQGSLLQTCVNCGTNKTPVWRRNPRNETICNACSLYMKNHNGRSRPSHNTTPPKAKDPHTLKPSKPTRTCTHCNATETPTWRRSPTNQVLCNACGVFQNAHGVPRPLSMKKEVVHRRKRGKQAGNGGRARLGVMMMRGGR
ncbi:glucocorticoid receptor-like (DNA-binding domain) [Rhizoclosmatium globosum]|uniref:Glucocorticoid receptor-like (DNA-binding domain) n=1 Tax=Rhizoclosmatium globosum TaxID=329046 RepID=A0A1Y2CF38_9FUNG|nr:glucocorticoid receptor-like (DNA-binding domain) [Rhizoclosmatium globosum]|eukprot:ORY45546.1 glucocorticoid receptor-like (DNA-binding domain) [Rhizoclosmatium globosum]